MQHSSVLEQENIDGNETDYAPSNDFDSPKSSDVGNIVQLNFKRFNKETDMEDPQFWVGYCFT